MPTKTSGTAGKPRPLADYIHQIPLIVPNATGHFLQHDLHYNDFNPYINGIGVIEEIVLNKYILRNERIFPHLYLYSHPIFQKISLIEGK